MKLRLELSHLCGNFLKPKTWLAEEYLLFSCLHLCILVRVVGSLNLVEVRAAKNPYWSGKPALLD